jgi:glycine cleavage system H protein
MKHYTKEHEWVRIEDDHAHAVVGITEHAAKQLGDLTYVELPEMGLDRVAGDIIATVESVKAASDVYAPMSGTVIAVNKALDEDPGIINQSPEERGWICRLDNIDVDEIEELMDEKAYRKYLKDTEKK